MKTETLLLFLTHVSWVEKNYQYCASKDRKLKSIFKVSAQSFEYPVLKFKMC